MVLKSIYIIVARSRALRLAQWRKLSDEVRGALVAAGVLVKIELVIRLSVPPFSCRHNLCDDLAVPPLFVGTFGDVLGNSLLLGRMEKDGGAVLSPPVGTLVVQLRGVVDGVEVLDELSVRDLLRVKGDL